MPVSDHSTFHAEAIHFAVRPLSDAHPGRQGAGYAGHFTYTLRTVDNASSPLSARSVLDILPYLKEGDSHFNECYPTSSQRDMGLTLSPWADTASPAGQNITRSVDVAVVD